MRFHIAIGIVYYFMLVASYATSYELMTFRAVKSDNAEDLCATSPPNKTRDAVGTRSHCLAICSRGCPSSCQAINYRKDAERCELFHYLPCAYDAQQNCVNYQKDISPDARNCTPGTPGTCHSNATCTPVTPYVCSSTRARSYRCECNQGYSGDGIDCKAIGPGCSFPYTYNGGLFYSCIENMPNISTADQPFACISVNATPVVCDDPGFVAINQTIMITVPTQPDFVNIKSVFGWIIITQHLGNTFDWQLPWADYKAGFGSIDADFWLGLEKIHLLTSSQPHRLRVEVQESQTNLWYSAEYWSFKIGDELNDKYRLEVFGYSGDAGDSLHYEGDWDGNGAFGDYNHNGMKFTTYDQDNDGADGNCAPDRGGGWWYNSCFWACLTCQSNRHCYSVK